MPHLARQPDALLLSSWQTFGWSLNAQPQQDARQYRTTCIERMPLSVLNVLSVIGVTPPLLAG